MAASSQKTFLETPLVQDAVLRNLLIQGKFIDRMPTRTKAKYRDLNRRCIGGLKNIITHNYLESTRTRMWRTIACYLPTFKSRS
jgi:uncharacterized protein with HEPN domain